MRTKKELTKEQKKFLEDCKKELDKCPINMEERKMLKFVSKVKRKNGSIRAGGEDGK